MLGANLLTVTFFDNKKGAEAKTSTPFKNQDYRI